MPRATGSNAQGLDAFENWVALAGDVLNDQTLVPFTAKGERMP